MPVITAASLPAFSAVWIAVALLASALPGPISGAGT